MAFMEPEIYEGEMWSTDTAKNGTMLFPANIIGKEEAAEHSDCDPNEVESVTGIFIRLSASGYMDCTDWMGPYESAEEARKELSETYDCCGECGGDWNDDGICSDCGESEDEDED